MSGYKTTFATAAAVVLSGTPMAALAQAPTRTAFINAQEIFVLTQDPFAPRDTVFPAQKLMSNVCAMPVSVVQPRHGAYAQVKLPSGEMVYVMRGRLSPVKPKTCMP